MLPPEICVLSKKYLFVVDSNLRVVRWEVEMQGRWNRPGRRADTFTLFQTGGGWRGGTDDALHIVNYNPHAIFDLLTARINAILFVHYVKINSNFPVIFGHASHLQFWDT